MPGPGALSRVTLEMLSRPVHRFALRPPQAVAAAGVVVRLASVLKPLCAATSALTTAALPTPGA